MRALQSPEGFADGLHHVVALEADVIQQAIIEPGEGLALAISRVPER